MTDGAPIDLAAVCGRAVSRFLECSGRERMRLFRLHLQAHVSSISPLAIDLAAYCGLTLDAVAALLTPPARWPSADGTHVPTMRPQDWAFYDAAQFCYAHALTGANGRALRAGSLISNVRSDERAEVGYAAIGSLLEVVAQVGPCMLVTHAGAAVARIAGELPETLVRGLPGHHLDELVEHPVLSGRGYVIESVRTDPNGSSQVIRFRTGTLPHAMPWDGILLGELERRS